MKGLLVALHFLTFVPVPVSSQSLKDLGRAGKWFPTVGLGLGLVLALVHFLLGRVFPSLLTAGLTVGLWAALTGGLHLDGLADCCDALPASVSPERRLEIAHDPRLGTFGSIGLVLFLLLKTLAIAALPATCILVFPLSASLGRWLVLLVACQPSARAGGLGATFALGLNRMVLFTAALVPLVLVILGSWRALIAAVFAHLVALGLIRLAHGRLGGVTGDVMGLSVEVSELAVLLVYAASLPALS